MTVRASNAVGFADFDFTVLVDVADFTATIVGAVRNPTFGRVAEHLVPLTARASCYNANTPQSVSYQWKTLESGAIPNATNASFLPSALSNDAETIYCTITPDGYPSRDTNALVIRHAPPTASGTLDDFGPLIFDHMTGYQAIETRADFKGLSLKFSVSGLSGTTIDSATGVVMVPTNLVSDAEIVTVTATNSGGAASSMFSVTVEGTEDSFDVSHGNIIFTFSEPFTVGNYADGPAYVVVPSGTATITKITPKETVLGEYTINGAMKNPQVAVNKQGFDARVTSSFDAAQKWTSGSVTAGDVIVKAAGNLDAAINPLSAATWRRGVVHDYGVLFVVTSEPAPGTFAPAAIGWTGRSSLTDYTINISHFVAGLPAYSTTGHRKPSYGEIMARIGKFNPALALFGSKPYGHRYFLTTAMGKDTDNYGRYIAGNIQAGMLALISDGYSTAEKEAIATALISHGIQWYDPYDGGNVKQDPDGGLFMFSFGPMAMALAQTGRNAKYAQLLSEKGGNMRQAIKVTAALAADLDRHKDLAKPYPYRERRLKAVTGNTLTIETWRSGFTEGDNSKFDLIGFTITNGTASAVVTSGAGQSIPAGTSGSFSFNVDDATGFATNDTVWFYPPIRAIEGDFDWAIRGYDQISQYSGQYGTTGEYRELNEISGCVLGLRGMGIWHTSWNAVQGLVMANNRDNWPLPTWNFSSSHGITYGASDSAFGWERDFWIDHSATILDFAAPAISDVAVAIGSSELSVSWSVDQTGRACVMAFPVGVSATLPARLLRGTDDGGVAAASSSGVITVSVVGAQTNVILTGLTNGESYDVYIVALDNWSNPSIAVSQDHTPVGAEK